MHSQCFITVEPRSLEHRLCGFVVEPIENNAEDPQGEFDYWREKARRLAEKYLDASKQTLSSEAQRNRERVQQYYKLEKALLDRITHSTDSGARAAIVDEMKDIADELSDALTRRTYNRRLVRPNRFDTKLEQQEVQNGSDRYKRRLLERRIARDAEERSSRAAEAKQLWHLEVPYRLIKSGALGADETINSAAERLLKQLPDIRTVKAHELTEFVGEVENQRKNNPNLRDATRKKLEALRESLKSIGN